MNEYDWMAERFEAHRGHLRAVAYRMLGSLSEADDAVQEAWLKLTRADSGLGQMDHHHFIPRGLVATVEGDTVRLTARADVVADLFEQEESGEPIG